MAKLPERTVQQDIDEQWVDGSYRPYLGGSYLGHNCMRYTWYKFHWYDVPRVEARMNRLFRLGDFIEEQIKESLESIGIYIVGDQQSVGGFWDHADGHTDGRVSNLPRLFEAKSMNDKNFKSYRKKGLQAFNSKYWYQIHNYMGKLALEDCLYVVMNKNDSSLDIQVIPFDPHTYKLVEKREMAVIVATSADDFEKIGGASWFECKFCEMKDVCHHKADAPMHCRSCKHSEPGPNGQWLCNHWGGWLDMAHQIAGCDMHEEKA